MNYYEDSIKALTALVALLRNVRSADACADPPYRIEGRVRIQKLVFLLKAYGLRTLDQVRYAYHHYGPYSEQVAGALQTGVASKLIREQKEVYDEEWQKFTYELNEQHPDATYLQLKQSELAIVDRLKLATDGLHWRTLELAATTVFLEREADLDRDQALERALGHKPACRPFKSEALRLLAQLDADLAQSAPA